jgi:hypothetical protein
MGKWVDQMLLLKSFAEDELDASDVSIIGFGELGLAAIFAEVAIGGFSSVTARRSPLSYKVGDKDTPFSMGIHIPGIINWGDIVMALAISTVDIQFVNPVSMDGEPVSEAYEKQFITDQKRLKAVIVS